MGKIVTVNFRGDTLFGFENDDGVYVALKPIVESMGMDWSAQYRRVTRDEDLREGIAMMATPFSRGGDQEAVCLKIDLVNGWLFTIDTARITDDAVREKVKLYKRECYGVLAKHFLGKHEPKALGEIVEDPQESETAKVRMITESRHTFGTQAAAQLWFRLGLPTVPAMVNDPRQLTFIDYGSVKANSEAA